MEEDNYERLFECELIRCFIIDAVLSKPEITTILKLCFAVISIYFCFVTRSSGKKLKYVTPYKIRQTANLEEEGTKKEKATGPLF